MDFLDFSPFRGPAKWTIPLENQHFSSMTAAYSFGNGELVVKLDVGNWDTGFFSGTVRDGTSSSKRER